MQMVYLSTHPVDDKRIAEIEKILQKKSKMSAERIR
jgi:predicted Zn-dependent protease